MKQSVSEFGQLYSHHQAAIRATFAISRAWPLRPTRPCRPWQRWPTRAAAAPAGPLCSCPTPTPARDSLRDTITNSSDESRICKMDFAESADGPGRKEPNHDPAGAGDASPPPSSPPCACAPAAAASDSSVAASVRGGVAGLSMPSLRSCSTRASTCAKPHWRQTKAISRPCNFRKDDARSCRRP